ncbi:MULTISPECIES: MFS transporter [unclassified Amycolatopsis]|uniref:MFS transporter n=1 Tax=unclassified Amycolatopsis TaxID=2618356 RepID=UPI0028763B9C|nr:MULTISPECIES: MFS transporter [unclassified Amycolatopsis]MDS0140404.1 MFS transporter [Amycolatopsis sp. 505]MDS0148991.1 MFS transporter [Amycolatopsis sp. CM201R]
MRSLLWGRGVSALGDGLWFTIWALYLTRIAGLPPVTVGAGLAVASAVGMAAAVPLGAFADRAGARPVLVVLTLVRAAAMAGYLAVDGTWSFLAVTVPFTALATGGTAVRTALVTALVTEPAERVRVLAQQRVAQHVGYAAGAGLGALVLTADARWAYTLAIAGNAVSFLVLAGATLLVPAPARTPVRTSTRAVLTDRPYLCVTAATAVLSLCWAMLSAGLPLWLSGRTHLPLGLGGVVVVLSSVGIAVFQVPFARFARTTGQAARTAVVSGVVLAVSCVLLATTSGGSGAAAIAVVGLAAVLHVVGELAYVAANWGLSVRLMREDAKGAYQGATEAATATVQMVGPGVFTLAVGGLGGPGWLLVAVVFLAAVAPVPALTRWAVRTRQPVAAR